MLPFVKNPAFCKAQKCEDDLCHVYRRSAIKGRDAATHSPDMFNCKQLFCFILNIFAFMLICQGKHDCLSEIKI